MSHKLFAMKFSALYDAYLNKVLRKERTEEELLSVMAWLTGYSDLEILDFKQKDLSFKAFFDEAPLMNPSRDLVTGVICGVRIENVEDPLMRDIRVLDKLVDELAKGKAVDKIIRKEP